MNRTGSLVLALGTAILAGCATSPGSQISAPPSGAQRVTYPTKKFALDTPPSPWTLTTEDTKAVVEWEKRSIFGRVRSILSVFVVEAPGLSPQGVMEMVEMLPGALADARPRIFRNQPAPTVTDQRETVLDGKRYRLVILEGFPSVQFKMGIYILQTSHFVYMLVLGAPLSEYAEDHRILEQMARSFSPLD